jgi:CcmD family protein
MNDITYVYIAYTIIFGGLAAYVFYLHQKQMKIAQDVELLEESVRSYAKEKRKRKSRK